mgnify:CR=1 FL=1
MRIVALIAVTSLLGEISYNALESSYYLLSSSSKYSHLNTIIQTFYLFFPKFYLFFPLYIFSKRIFFSLYFFYLSLDKTPFFLELNQKIPYFLYIIFALIPFLSMKYKKKKKEVSSLEEATSIKEVLVSDKFSKFLESVMWSNFQIDYRLFKELKKDFWKEFIKE